jgi:ribosomal protein S8
MNNLFQKLNESTLHKKQIIEIPLKKSHLKIIKCLAEENIIDFFSVNKTNKTMKIKFNFSNKNEPIIQKIKFYKASSSFFFKFQELFKHINKNQNEIFLIENSNSILSNKAILKKRFGGNLLAKIII